MTSAQTGARDRPDPRTDDEQEFLAELSGFGLPTEMTAVTTIEVGAGIAHAFNGSFQQAQAYLDLGMKLGFGGALSHPPKTNATG